jgi:hypothetical protein
MALTDSLIAAWELNEASGDAIDSHGGLTLTDTNTVGSGTGLVYGAARDVELDNDEYFTRTDGSDLSTGDIDFTCEAWFNLESLPGVLNSARVLLSKCNDSSGSAANVEFALYAWDDAILYFDVSNGSTIGEVGATTFGAAGTGSWIHVIAWHDSVANTVNIQINGGTVDSVSYSGGGSDTAFDFKIGHGLGQGTADRKMDGLIGPVRFWKRVLTADERTSLYNAGSGRAYSAFGAAASTTDAKILIAPVGYS